MSAQNPFQIPTCFKLDLEQRRRERFKKTVVAAVIVSAAVVVGLLIEGCVSEKSQNAMRQSQVGDVDNSIETPAPAPTKAMSPPTARPAPRQTISSTSLLMQRSVAMVPKTASPLSSYPKAGEAVYLVKSGDTLTRIAKTHKTTIHAIKLANNLGSDRIFVGEKLKVPSA